MSVNHPTDLLPAFALGCLEDDERTQVRRHLRDCADCRVELAAYQDVTGRLAFGAPSEGPPDFLKQRLMERIGRSRPIGWLWFEKLTDAWPRLIPVAIVAGVMLVFALGVSHIILWRQMVRLESNNLIATHLVWLQATPEAAGANGTLIVGPDETRAVLLVEALKPLTPEFQYQLWLISDGRRTSGGVFSVTAEGRAKVKVTADRPLVDFDAFGITIEPFGGSPGPTGKKVMGGKMKL